MQSNITEGTGKTPFQICNVLFSRRVTIGLTHISNDLQHAVYKNQSMQFLEISVNYTSLILLVT